MARSPSRRDDRYPRSSRYDDREYTDRSLGRDGSGRYRLGSPVRGALIKEDSRDDRDRHRDRDRARERDGDRRHRDDRSRERYEDRRYRSRRDGSRKRSREYSPVRDRRDERPGSGHGRRRDDYYVDRSSKRPRYDDRSSAPRSRTNSMEPPPSSTSRNGRQVRPLTSRCTSSLLT
ncbi:hypothetical protein BAUCODRAFT_193543 [Baudoinia panamericana UAMH 10762]|uniref:Uncharacterized protein n=1 Tax=Baudoinia panamericana (strain UAMH 10762) TaxID=717646 RepID=M2NPX8_BAUPA|nr:uncharacterized protein BAUCODRAFT_193543 [Baudoinia panamericana UAMH 10762]EMD01036.1 hypothetical protein BAUCODRAFT_193543 [Baudoinia panamericana UAMH 10762]